MFRPSILSLLVFAAASMRNAIVEVNEQFTEGSGIKVLVSFGGSQTLAQQIGAGAPADVFISAGSGPVTFLSDQNRLADNPTPIIKNRLVVVSQTDAPFIESVAGILAAPNQRVAIADPNFAPAGAYARESLVGLHLWDSLQKRIVIAADVRAALAYVETGNADFAIVYETDALSSDSVRISDVIPTDIYSEVIYPAVVPTTANAPAIARRYVDFLSGQAAGKIFEAHGFEHIAR